MNILKIMLPLSTFFFFFFFFDSWVSGNLYNGPLHSYPKRLCPTRLHPKPVLRDNKGLIIKQLSKMRDEISYVDIVKSY